MTTRARVYEAGRLDPITADGLYPVTIITEGEGSSGRYSRELLERQASYWAESLSFMDHPVDPSKPWERSVEKIGGRLVGDTYFVVEDGIGKIKGFWRPREGQWARFIEQFGDALGLSVYAQAEGTKLPDGRLDVDAWLEDPYRSVDVVVAAGRGGQFDKAMEAKRAIESSLGESRGDQPHAASASGEQEGEEVEEKVEKLTQAVEALTGSLTTFITEQRAAVEAAAEAEAEAPTTEDAVKTAVEAFASASKAISEADILPSAKTSLLESAQRGEDVTQAIESAKTAMTEAKALFTAESASYGRTQEGGGDIPTFSFERKAA